MLEKIGLPPKPSVRGNNWVADASHCQGCSCQFTFINRKHHCRRCGGLFCNSCTQQRMVLRGQGDSPVRICEPCKKLEEAARFELRHGRRAGRGSLKSTPRDEDEILNQILGQNREETSENVLRGEGQVGIASSSSTKEHSNSGDVSNDKPNILGIDLGSITPDELRQQALEEKKKYKLLKGDKKSEEALKAFKRGKELERQADALEIQLRKARKKTVSVESVTKTKSLPHMGKEKDDLTSELRELGWSDVDLHTEDKRSASLSLEGELSLIIGKISPKTGEEKKGSRIDKSGVVAMKKKALMLKHEGKLAEAKEELKRAKILEKQLEEQEILAEAEDSDDELSAVIHGMDDDVKGEFPDLHVQEHGHDFGQLLGIDDLDGNFEVTDEDMMDPDLAAALESLGWTEPENTFSKSETFDKEALLGEIQSLKREALNQKRAGNTEEAMTFLKKAKLLERSLNSPGSEIVGNGSDSFHLDERNTNATSNAASTVAPKSRLMIQRELLSLKKKALTLRREGKLNEAEEEMRKGAALEHQLMDMDKASNLKASKINSTENVPHAANKHSDIHRNLPLEEGSEDDVTDQDMSDPAYLSLLRDLGWNDDNNELSNSPSKPLKKDDNDFVATNVASLNKNSTKVFVGAPRRSKVEIQRELLGLKRKALALRREGKDEDAEEVLKKAKDLEAKMAEMEAPKNESRVDATMMKDKLFNPLVETAIDEERDGVVSEEDMHDPALNSMLVNLGWKNDELETATTKEEPVKEATSRFTRTEDISAFDSSSSIPATASRSKGEIQRELLVLKRKALGHRRKGEIEEAEEVLRMAKSLEAQMEDFGSQNKELLLDVSKEEKSVLPGSYDFLERHGSQGVAVEVDKGSASSVVVSSKHVPELEIPATFQLTDNKHSLSAEVSASSENIAKKMKSPKTTGPSNSAGYSMHMQDLLTGDGYSSYEVSTQEQKEHKLSSANSSQAGPPIHLDSSVNLSHDQGSKSNVTTQRGTELAGDNQKPNITESNAVEDPASQYNLSLRQQILARKRKAVALKREGKLIEAREELRQAKLLEKNLEDGSMQPNTALTHNVSDASLVQKKQDSPNVTAKPLTSRDRFKLQQESLGHKRQALKLRREGRIEEAEAESERAKAIEIQLEESTAHDAGKSDAVDDVTVEDFLDPQLLSALKAAGIEGASVASRAPDRAEPLKPNVARIENSNQERNQLEERIKEEKLKAVTLKRSGKQAEALDALRRAKLYEKKLNSITSG
ncbi:hypothetical protein TanjilG_25648 [Lupinus angustifolius]|uniref:FYVE-type domain-containing protein n=1 Tax=Lupinus angustifolius TaxID=3871 RepID=A0A4P1QTK5_LUPAN|nr:PREDICTED: uncharacterized protein LOC109331252 isoform X1 [Lupinus angustifolius]XP_019421178.1 PREDICTED: uncharacterized protein LOC109331252 isoform X1 [Lupinus angustifolius]OIV94586.1 hypothetical protein TanjilG_25648 [Lupinus angustifolius]